MFIKVKYFVSLNIFNNKLDFYKLDFNKLKQYRFSQLENPDLPETQQYI